MSRRPQIELMEVRCNNCGAPLNVADGVNFVTCQHCHAQLAVRRNESAAYTEVLEAFTREAQQLRGQVERLTQQNELTALDQSWARTRESYLVYPKDGRPYEPSVAKAIIQGLVVGAIGIVWTVFAGATFPPFALLGLLAIGGAIFGTIHLVLKAQRFEQARDDYLQQRRKLLSEMGDQDVDGARLKATSA